MFFYPKKKKDMQVKLQIQKNKCEGRMVDDFATPQAIEQVMVWLFWVWLAIMMFLNQNILCAFLQIMNQCLATKERGKKLSNSLCFCIFVFFILVNIYDCPPISLTNASSLSYLPPCIIFCLPLIEQLFFF